MGHQSTFYLTPKDTADLEQRLRQKTNFIILLRRSPTASPRIVDSLNFAEEGEPGFSKYLVRPEDLDKVILDYIAEQGYWTLQDSPSPVVEFSRCRFDGNTLSDGRVYYVDKGWILGHGEVVKSEAFQKWAKMVHTTIKKSLLKQRRSSFVEYIGADAQAWVAAGGQLVDGFGRPVTW